MKYVKLKSLLLPLITCSLSLNAQKLSRLELGGGLSTFVYQGDLTPQFIGATKTIRPGTVLFANYFLQSNLAIQASINKGRLYANDAVYKSPAWRQQRNFNFVTPVTDFNVKLLYIPALNVASGIEPYVSAGLGFVLLNIKKDYSQMALQFIDANGIAEGIAADNVHGTPASLIEIPLTIGGRKYLNEKFDFFAELNYRLVFTDYLDGFKESASNKNGDKYYTVNAGVILKFNARKGIKCPPVKG
jgi:hypothetical protein